MTEGQRKCLGYLTACGTLSDKTLRGLGVHPNTLRSLVRRKLIRRSNLRSRLLAWEVTR